MSESAGLAMPANSESSVGGGLSMHLQADIINW